MPLALEELSYPGSIGPGRRESSGLIRTSICLRADSNGLEAHFNRLLALQAQLTSNAFTEAAASQRQVSKMLVVIARVASSLALLVRGVDQIADAVSAQSEGGRGIAEHIEHIARMAGEGDAITRQVSGAVVSLRELSDELSLAVSRFRF